MYENEPVEFMRKNCTLLGEGFFQGTLLDLGTYPGAIYDKFSEYKVFGEIFEIQKNKKELVAYLDRFEGVGEEFTRPNEYVREVIPIETHNGTLHASCYLYNLDWNEKMIIYSGKYENAKGTRPGDL